MASSSKRIRTERVVVVSFPDQRAQARHAFEEVFDDEDAFEKKFAEYYTERGELSEYGTEKIAADISVDGTKVGSIKCTLVDREALGAEFHAACDCDSQDLQEIGVKFFARDGRTSRLAAAPKVCAGGLLYLESFKIDVEDASSEIATAALRQLLLTRLEGAWGLCVYIPEAMPHLTPSEQASVEGERELQIAEIMGMEVPREAPNEDRARMMRRALRRDATPFLRCGFAQADELLLRAGQCTFLFASPPALASPPASHEAATAICLAVPKAAVVLSAVDSELREYCVSLYNRDRYQVASVVAPDADFAARLGGFIARGASVKGAGCVHCAAATDHLEHLELLCALGGPETIKALDNNSHTPLMVAAGAVLGKSSRFTPPSTKTIVTLLSKGADKTIVNDLGRTALGIFWGTVKSSNDFEHTFGIPVEDRHCYDMEGICATIEALLMPPAGPTDADLANKDDSDDDD